MSALADDFSFYVENAPPMSVVRFQLVDEMSKPYRLDVVVHVGDPDTELAPEDLLGSRASLRIATSSSPATRCVHGIVFEAEELGTTRTGVLYELRLAPPLDRASLRSQSRIYVEKTTREIIEAVLGRDSLLTSGAATHGDCDLHDDFAPANEHYEWRIADTPRLDELAARPYCVQYQESDLDFIGRLLEEEGVAYHFEHTPDAVVLVFSDTDAGRRKLDPFDPVGPNIAGRELGALTLGGRMRPKKVKLTGFNWQKPRQDMTATADDGGDEHFVVAHPGNYPDAPEQGKPLARAMLERLQTESSYAVGEGSCRLMEVGAIFPFEHPRDRYRGEYLVIRAVTKGWATGELPPGYAQRHSDVPFETRVECARRGRGDQVEESKYRPARNTPKPRIQGSQTAIVTDDPDTRGAEIHVGGPPGNENGCVRLKFHWDIETDRHDKEPTSCWVRVSQALAGAGGGSVWHPRVGTEVIVDFLDGDPDRPIVVGRVYNGEQPPAALGKGAATISIMKSLASPGGAVHNEFGFDDTAGKEQVKLHAGKDWNSTAGNDRNESVGNNSGSTVSVNRTEDTGADRTTSVGGSNTESVTGDETISVGGSQNLSVSASQTFAVAATRTLVVGGAHSVATGPEDYTVNGPQTVNVAAIKTENIGAVYGLSVGAAMSVSVGATKTVSVGGAYSLGAPVVGIEAPLYTVSCSSGTIQGSDLKVIGSGSVLVQGADVTIAASGTLTLTGPTVNIEGGTVSVVGGAVTIAGGSTDITGGTVNVN